MMRRCLAVLVLVASALAFENVRAAPLDAATCGMLKGEQAQLEHGGVRNNMVKGPEWAKANLPADQLEQIRRLLNLDEQLLFRCSARTLVELPPDADAEPSAKAPAENDKDASANDEPGAALAKDKAPAAARKAAPAGPKKAANAPAKPDGPTTGNAPATREKSPQPVLPPKKAGTTAPLLKGPPAGKPGPAVDAGAGPPAQKAAAKPSAKKKADDAYKAPPPDPSLDPFGSQPQ